MGKFLHFNLRGIGENEISGILNDGKSVFVSVSDYLCFPV